MTNNDTNLEVIKFANRSQLVETYREKLISLYVAWSVALTAISISLMYVITEYLRWSDWLSSIWLTGAGDSGGNNGVLGVHSFTDLSLNLAWAKSSSPYLSLVSDGSLPYSNYPPFTHVFLDLFHFFSYSQSVVILSMLTLALLITPTVFALGGLSYSHKVTTLVAGFVFTYPTLMILDRGNIQGIVTGISLFAVFLFIEEKYLFSAVLLGFVAALKIYPILFIVIFLKHRRYHEFFVSLATFAGLTLISLMSFHGNMYENLNGFLRGLGVFAGGVADADVSALLRQNHSFLALVAYLGEQDLRYVTEISQLVFSNYSIVMMIMILILGILSFVVFRQNDNQLLLTACTVMVLVPSLTYGYILSFYFVVLLHLFHKKTDLLSLPRSYVKGTVIAIALLLVAKGIPLGIAFSSLMNIVNPVLLFLLICLSYWKAPLNSWKRISNEGP